MTKEILEVTLTRNGIAMNRTAALTRPRSSNIKDIVKNKTKRFQPIDQILGDIINHAQVLET